MREISYCNLLIEKEQKRERHGYNSRMVVCGRGLWNTESNLADVVQTKSNEQCAVLGNSYLPSGYRVILGKVDELLNKALNPIFTVAEGTKSRGLGTNMIQRTIHSVTAILRNKRAQ
ncbi:hypothetical protein J6590_065850 [Homalodisca vitripennis]|nr:hypothetical protein J6590_065850 [Homalodisca vitripennis]